jgi:hypothetical protein
LKITEKISGAKIFIFSKLCPYKLNLFSLNKLTNITPIIFSFYYILKIDLKNDSNVQR